jgi:hypothetical protein
MFQWELKTHWIIRKYIQATYTEEGDITARKAWEFGPFTIYGPYLLSNNKGKNK